MTIRSKGYNSCHIFKLPDQMEIESHIGTQHTGLGNFTLPKENRFDSSYKLEERNIVKMEKKLWGTLSILAEQRGESKPTDLSPVRIYREWPQNLYSLVHRQSSGWIHNRWNFAWNVFHQRHDLNHGAANNPENLGGFEYWL